MNAHEDVNPEPIRSLGSPTLMAPLMPFDPPSDAVALTRVN
jgi:hypothetical protein